MADRKRIDAIMKKYQIKNPEKTIPTKYSFQEKGFYRTLTHRVKEKLSVSGHLGNWFWVVKSLVQFGIL
jgi:hypothetical protein